MQISDHVGFISKEIILVDDASTDGTKELIQNKLCKMVTKVIYHEHNILKCCLRVWACNLTEYLGQ